MYSREMPRPLETNPPLNTTPGEPSLQPEEKQWIVAEIEDILSAGNKGAVRKRLLRSPLLQSYEPELIVHLLSGFWKKQPEDAYAISLNELRDLMAELRNIGDIETERNELIPNRKRLESDDAIWRARIQANLQLLISNEVWDKYIAEGGQQLNMPEFFNKDEVQERPGVLLEELDSLEKAHPERFQLIQQIREQTKQR